MFNKILAALLLLLVTLTHARNRGTMTSRRYCTGSDAKVERCHEAFTKATGEFLDLAYLEEIDYCMKPGGKQKVARAINCCGNKQCWWAFGTSCYNHCGWGCSFKGWAGCCGQQQAPEGCYDHASCPEGWHTCNGGSYCIKGTTGDCALKVLEGVATILESVASIALMCLTAGTSSAAKAGIKASVKTATKATSKAAAMAAMKQGAKAMARNFKRNLKEHFKDKALRQDIADAIMENAAEQMIAAELDLEDLAWDLAEVVDPTGIASVVRFYADVDECKYPKREGRLNADDVRALNDATGPSDAVKEQCASGHDDRPGATSEERCEAMDGCFYTTSTDHCQWGADDECREGHDSRMGATSEQRCRALDGCCYGPGDHCDWCGASASDAEYAVGQDEEPDAAVCSGCVDTFVSAGGCDALKSGDDEAVAALVTDMVCHKCAPPCEQCGLGYDDDSDTGCSAAVETSVGIALDAFTTEKLFSANNALLIPCLFFGGMGVGMWFMKKDKDSASGYLLATEEI